MYLQIAEGMRAVNTKVVHRDLKPDNVLIDERTKQLKITDFGLAKLVDAATRSETFKGWGTRPYQAPEAFEHGPNTIAMDIYAAGVTFFELATLTWPVQPKPGDHSALAWRNAHLLMAPTSLRLLRPDMPNELVQLITLMLQKDPSRRPASWDNVIERLQKSSHRAATGPDVSALVQKATTTLLNKTAQQSKEREARERQAERHALLEQAFAEPIQVLKSLIDTFNDASAVGNLELSEQSLSVEVRGSHSRTRLVLKARVIDDLNAQSNGIFRMIGIARLDPAPSVANEIEAVRDRESFGSFNLGYRVNQAADRFGKWRLYRFEHHPLTTKISYPRWFAVDLDELPRQLQALSAMGIYQNQQHELDYEWFQSLLTHLL
jgi:serine/threonine protein kinase